MTLRARRATAEGVRHILVTGANKGIGLAIVERILAEHDDCFAFLGSRDAGRGRAAAEGLVKARPAWAGRLAVVAIDVADDASVAGAAKAVAERLAGEALYGLVNNAGVGAGGGDRAAILQTNVLGVHRACEAFLPLLDAKRGRIVNVTSASGPSFVAGCSAERRRFFLDAALTWTHLRAFVDECIAAGDDAAALAALGLGDGAPYGLSKACANAYTRIVAREHPGLDVNACTPGFVATDMTRHYAASAGKTPAELGMKTPAEGATAPLHLLFGELEGNGRYYGSDAKRSPLDRYRAPGSPEYAGD